MEFIAFSDLHLNKFPKSNITKDGENELLMAGLGIIDQVCNYAINNNVKYIIFNGDLFHIRTKIDSDIYSNKALDRLWQYFGPASSHDMRLVLIPGNHDQIDKVGTHTLKPYALMPNINVVDNLYATNRDLVFCPHQYNIEDLYFFLEKNSDENSLVFIHQLIFNSPTMKNSIFKKNEAVDVSRFKYKYLFSGHNHRPFENKKLNVYNIGSPMHYDFGDAECQDRFFIHFKEDKVSWIKTEFPHFAVHGSQAAESASYVQKKSKKVVKQSKRVEITFNDDIPSILHAYLDTVDTSLDKGVLLEKGLKLLRNDNSNIQEPKCTLNLQS